MHLMAKKKSLPEANHCRLEAPRKTEGLWGEWIETTAAYP